MLAPEPESIAWIARGVVMNRKSSTATGEACEGCSESCRPHTRGGRSSGRHAPQTAVRDIGGRTKVGEMYSPPSFNFEPHHAQGSLGDRGVGGADQDADTFAVVGYKPAAEQGRCGHRSCRLDGDAEL